MDVTERTTGATQEAGGRIGSEYLRRARHEQEWRIRAQKIQTDPMSRVVWDEDGKAFPKGRAATYTSAMHTVTANATLSFYVELLQWAVNEVRIRSVGSIDEATAQTMAENEVRRWFEQALIEVVVALPPLANDPDWVPAGLDDG